ncbi:hypothetical protein BpHYR1_000520 [Brachionus plicatilis]|uniref:Uncharacterized protein n=1 Tax=Brachionus plicatilis TaxID=10195 RepID=A0A3M7R474_BRAPC|nr:hypothetical protein BpHYR1_000520 [Brachionus plicatilis]
MLSLLYQLLSIRSNPDNLINELYTELVTKMSLKQEMLVQEFVSKFGHVYSDFLFQMQERKVSCADRIKLAIDECLAANFGPRMHYLTVPEIKNILKKIKLLANKNLVSELSSLNTKFGVDAEFFMGEFELKPSQLLNIQIQNLPNLENIRQFRILKKHFGEIYKLSKVVNKNQVLSASKDNSIKLWDLDKMECVWTICVNRPEFVIAGNRVICAENEGCIKIFDLASGKMVRTLVDVFLDTSSILLLNENKILTGLMNGEILIWNMKNLKICDTFPGHLMKVTDFKMLNASSFISSSWDRNIKLWNLGADEAIRTFNGHRDWVTCLEMFNENEFISGSKDGTIKIWHKNLTCYVESLDGHLSGVNEIKVFENYQLLSCSEDGTIKHWDSVRAVCLKTLKISDQFSINDFIIFS